MSEYSPFFKLPYELRHMIYRNALQKGVLWLCVRCNFNHSFQNPYFKCMTGEVNAAILLVSKLFYSEARRVLYAENVFYVAGNQPMLPGTFINTIGLVNSAIITSLAFDLAGCPFRWDSRPITEWFRQLPALRELRFLCNDPPRFQSIINVLDSSVSLVDSY